MNDEPTRGGWRKSGASVGAYESSIKVVELHPKRNCPFALDVMSCRCIQRRMTHSQASKPDTPREYVRFVVRSLLYLCLHLYSLYSRSPMRPVYEQPVVTRAIDNNRFVPRFAPFCYVPTPVNTNINFH